MESERTLSYGYGTFFMHLTLYSGIKRPSRHPSQLLYMTRTAATSMGSPGDHMEWDHLQVSNDVVAGKYALMYSTSWKGLLMAAPPGLTLVY